MVARYPHRYQVLFQSTKEEFKQGWVLCGKVFGWEFQSTKEEFKLLCPILGSRLFAFQSTKEEFKLNHKDEFSGLCGCFNPPKRNLNYTPSEVNFLKLKGFNPPKRNLNLDCIQRRHFLREVSIHQRGI